MLTPLEPHVHFFHFSDKKKKKKNSSFLAGMNGVSVHPSLKRICPRIETESEGTTASQ
jgi:hypothetical protein